MKLFTKKFRVRVRHYTDKYYVVDYAYYRIFPNWGVILFWFDQGHPGGTECWSEKMFTVKEAEEFAKTLNTFQDIVKYYQPLIVAADKWKHDEIKWKAENIPYYEKYFGT